MAASLLEQQRGAIFRMLDAGGSARPWKLLVADRFCQELLATVVTRGDLRDRGVTLVTTLHSDRQPVGGVPCVYLVEPTEENTKRISEDLGNDLYESCYINFASAVPRLTFERFARSAADARAAQKVAGAFDRYVSFVSLSPTLFSLSLPTAYATIHSPSIADQVIQQLIERIVDGLLSVLVTMRSLPIIRCPASEVAEMVARRLEQRVRELLLQRGGEGAAVAAELLSPPGPVAAAQGGARGLDVADRPLLCILDRDMDLVTMLSHTWTYRAMAHDILGMRLGKLTVPVEGRGDASAPPRARSYDIDDGDRFWRAHADDPFPSVMEAVQESMDDFAREHGEMTKSNVSADVLNSLSEMAVKKQSLEMHTNIATALLNEVRARDLDRYYVAEDQFSSQSLGTSCAQLEQLIMDKQKGTAVDKARALMVLYLTKPSMPQAQLQGLVDALQSSNGDGSGIAYLQHLAAIRSLPMPGPAAGAPPAGPAGPPSGGLWVVFGGNAMVGTDWFEFCWMLLSRLPRSGPQPAFLLVDYPGYGANAGEPSPGGALAASIAACHAALPCLPAPPAELHILGHSLGAAAAAQLAARLPSERGAVGALRRGRLVLSAPFLNIEAMAQTIFGKIVGAAEGGRTPPAWALWPLLAHHWDNARQVPRAARAGWDVSIVLGARDEIVPPSMGRALRDMVEQSGGQCNFVEVPRVGHNDVVFKAIPQYAALMGFPAHSPL